MTLAQLKEIVAQFVRFLIIDYIKVLFVGIHFLDVSDFELLHQILLLLGHHVDPDDLIGAISHQELGLIRVEARERGLS